jgi:hypothetical protein
VRERIREENVLEKGGAGRGDTAQFDKWFMNTLDHPTKLNQAHNFQKLVETPVTRLSALWSDSRGREPPSQTVLGSDNRGRELAAAHNPKRAGKELTGPR